MSQWFLIDRDGRRPVRSANPDFFSSFDYDGGPTWPQFVQLAVDASLKHVLKAVETTAMVNGLDLEDVSARPEAWDSALVVIRNGGDGVLIGDGRSADLITWEPATYLGRQNNDDGATSTLFFEATSPSVLEREFIRFEMIEE